MSTEPDNKHEHTQDKPDPTARLAAYAVIGAALGAITVWFVSEGFALTTLGSGLIGGAVAGVIAGFVRARAGLDS